MKKYPDVSELLRRKEAARRALTTLPIEKKMEIAQRLREAGSRAPGFLRRTQTNKSVWSMRTLTKKSR
jgi:hypothetical protein